MTHTAISENTAILNLLLAPGENYFFLDSVFLLKFNAVQNKWPWSFKCGFRPVTLCSHSWHTDSLVITENTLFLLCLVRWMCWLLSALNATHDAPHCLTFFFFYWGSIFPQRRCELKMVAWCLNTWPKGMVILYLRYTNIWSASYLILLKPERQTNRFWGHRAKPLHRGHGWPGGKCWVKVSWMNM